MLILISDAFDKILPEKLRKFGEVTDDKSRTGEADIVLVRAKTKCDQEWIDSAKNCKLIIRGGVGIDNIDKAYAESKGIIVANTPNASSIAVAELTFALMLSSINNICYYHHGMRHHEWLKSTKRNELYGKTIGFIGMGKIARQVAKRCIAFGMDAIAYDIFVTPTEGVKFVSTVEEAVENADIVSLHVPATPETDGMVNASLISKMRKAPILVNTCRGKVINADDVKAALDEGKLSWYAADVYPTDDPEKLFSMDYPIFRSAKTTLTPHVGANTNENMIRIGDEIVSTIEKLIGEGKL